MKIESLRICSFHGFSNKEIDLLSPGLTLIYGPNEAGKSTFFNSIIYMLFGLPKKKSVLKDEGITDSELPFAKGVLISDNNRKYFLTRYCNGDADLNVPHEDRLTKDLNQYLEFLKDGDSSVVRKVYLFTLDDIHQFEGLNDSAIRERLTSAETGTGKISLNSIYQELDSTADIIFKERGRTEKIHSILSEIASTDTELNAFSNYQDRYDKIELELKKTDKDLKEIAGERAGTETEIQNIERIISIWGDITNYINLKDQVDHKIQNSFFPVNGLDKLNSQKTQYENLSGVLQKTSEKYESTKTLLSEINADNIINDFHPVIIALRDGFLRYEENVKRYDDLSNKQIITNEQLQTIYKELGEGWEDSLFEKIPVSIPTREYVSEKSREYQALEASLNKKIDEKEKLKGKKTEIENEIHILSDEIANTTETDIIQLKRRIQVIENFRVKYPDYIRRKDKISSNLALIQILAQQEKVKENIRDFPYLKPFLFIFAGTVLLLLSLTAKNNLMFTILFYCTIISFLFGGFYAVYIFFTTLKTKEKRSSEKKGKIKEIVSENTHLEEQIDGIEESLITIKKVFKLDNYPDPFELESLYAKYTRELEGVKQVYEVRMKIDSLNKDLITCNSSIQENENEIEDLKLKRSVLMDEWNDWRKTYHLSSNLSPLGVMESFSLIKAVKEKTEIIRERKMEIDHLGRIISEYEAYARETGSKCGIVVEGREIEFIAKELTRLYEKNIERSNEVKSKTKELASLEFELDIIKKDKEYLESEIQSLFLSCDCTSEEDFRRKANEIDGLNFDSERLNLAKAHIEKTLSEGEIIEDLINLYLSADLSIYREKLFQLSDVLTNNHEETAKLNQKRGRMEKGLEELKRMNTAPLLRQKREELIDSLNESAKEWSKIVFARNLLKRAMHIFEMEHEPKVLKEAEQIFQKITDNRYIKIINTSTNNGLSVIDEENKETDATRLSRGTLEQLYLSLRLGYIKEYEREREHFPLIFDDPLVNFDHNRLKKVCQIISNISKNNQVIYFTCHPSVLEIFQSVKPDLKVILL